MLSSIEFIGALNTGLIYSFVALGVYLSFRTLQFPDMTVDGSFPLGAAICATLIVSGYDPFLAMVAAFLGGALAGLITAFMATRFKILNLLAGIITMAALYSINLRIMGRPNVALLGQESAISKLQDLLTVTMGLDMNLGHLVILSVFILGAVILLYGFLSSHLGLALRATGSNPTMARAQGISDQKMILLGLALSNGLVAFGGALFAQTSGFADVNLGVGTIIIGLAAVIIGETFLPPNRIYKAIAGVVLGALVYRLIIAFALRGSSLGLQASDLNLVTATLLAGAMSLPQLQKMWRQAHTRQKGNLR
jgi:putative ABC transport system permease protein